MTGDPEPLEDGWSPTTPVGDTLLNGYVTGFADWMEGLGAATASRTLLDHGLAALDVGSQFFLANGAVLRRPVRDDAWPALVDRLRAFYDGGPGGPWTLLSAWPTPDLTAEGLELVGHPPFMVRPVAGAAPADPPGLDIVEARDETTMRDFARALSESYPAPDADFLGDPRVLTVPGTRCWVGYVDDRPVGTAAAHSTAACTHVEWISAHPDVRGRGIGAALTWRATLADPDVAATLLSSDPGQPVYERMGYLRIARFTAWMGTRQ